MRAGGSKTRFPVLFVASVINLTKFLWKVAPEVASAERERLGSEAWESNKKTVAPRIGSGVGRVVG